ncbi:MAG: hypothetical protein QOF60_159 [Actinomycetota bacterium]|jgi:hypothetical protein|nr:hypothetical protein [Actinomycetota bacterium]
MSSERLERVLAGDYASGLEDLSLEEVRARRHECQEIEVGLSYARRLVQGRLDIIHSELERRQSGAGRSDASELVDRLKEGGMLGQQVRPAGFGRLPTLMAPDQASDEFSGEIDEIADPQSLATLPELSDDVIGKLADRLTTLERSLSERRRSVFDRIDAFQAEIVRRYKTGSANPDELLA